MVLHKRSSKKVFLLPELTYNRCSLASCQEVDSVDHKFALRELQNRMAVACLFLPGWPGRSPAPEANL